MTKENKERKKILAEYFDELLEEFDRNKDEVDIKTKELEDLSKRGKELYDEITVVKKLYDKFESDFDGMEKPQMNSLAVGSYEHSINEPVSVLEALRIIFSFSPAKQFEPVELKDELESLRRKNLLDSEAENLLWMTHSALRTLLRKGFIKKNIDGNKPTYQKSFSFSDLSENMKEIREKLRK